MKTKNENTEHQGLLRLLEPLIEHMDANGHNYFLVAGKDGKCARYMRGSLNDLVPMLTGMSENNKSVDILFKKIFTETLKNKP